MAKESQGQERLVRLPEVMKITSVSRTFIYDAMAKQSFPCALKLGGRSIAWKLSEINKWIDSRQKVNMNIVGNA